MLHTSKIPAEHKIEYKEAILVILKGVPQIDNVWVINLTGLEQSMGILRTKRHIEDEPLQAIVVLELYLRQLSS